MQTKLWTTIVVMVSALTLSGCQALSMPSSEPNPVPKSANNYGNEIYETLTTLIPPIPDSDGDGVLDDIDNCPKTPVNTVVDNDGCPVTKNLMGPFALEIKTYFEQGSAEFLREGYATDIDKLADKFAAYSYLPIIILGHISKPEALLIQTANSKQATNKTPINKQLAQDRAQLVKDRLVSQGISASKIFTYDCGTSYQVISDDAEANIFMNQRVFGWSAVEDEKYIVRSYGLEGYKEKCKAFQR
ncbi:OmpA family protein [Psychrobacter sp. ASPA161_6]|uniref:OmpA family protein n=1 Tax=Psychrobacter sp. ASPA161_6 TaxID=3160962 RepID=UPI003F7E4A6B